MLEGKCALITGSTQGLGYAMAERLAAQGCDIVLNGFGDADEIERKRLHLANAHGVAHCTMPPISLSRARSPDSWRPRSEPSVPSTS